MQQVCKEGFVPADTFEELKFPQDRDITGSKVRHDTTITQEVRQRVKILTHEFQGSLREVLVIERQV